MLVLLAEELPSGLPLLASYKMRIARISADFMSVIMTGSTHTSGKLE
jgi:hypothetical protein